MRILCIGDSLGLPRENVEYESVWFYKLQNYFPEYEFISQFERGLLIQKALDNFDTYYTFYCSDIIIIQTGICDCAPRYIVEKGISIRIVKKLFTIFGLTKFYWKIIKLRGRKPSCVETPIDVFSTKYNELVLRFIKGGAKRIYLITIGHVAESVVKKSPYINNNVDKYNREIRQISTKYPEIVRVISPLDRVDESYFVDGYHGNAQGMDVVYNSLKTELSKVR